MIKKRRITDFAVSLTAIFVGLILVFPVVYCILGAFKTPAEFASPKFFPNSFSNLSNFNDALNRAPVFRYMLNSLIVSLLGTIVCLIFSIMAAYAFTHFEFRLKKFCFFFVLGTMMLPGDILLVTNYITVSRLKLLNTYLGMCIISFINASQVFMLRQSFLSVPKDLRYAAMIDGCGDIRYILSVLLPVCRPVVVTLFAKSFIGLWNSYLWPLIVTASSADMRTIMVGITKLNSWEDTNYELVLAGVTLSLIPSFLLFLVMRRSLTKGGAEGALVG